MPWFINWDDYKTSFEQQAGRILGHPVKVIGSANASILPTPSLTFTNVRVGDADAPLMTVERFEVTIELMPLIQGEIRVTSMRIDQPSIRLSVDEQGGLDWLARGVDSETLDPDKIVLAAVSISNGDITYSDPRTGVELAFADINATVEARSLAGPWRVDGSYRDGDAAVPFHLATGRWLPDGTIRLKSDFTPAQFPVDVSADGVLSQDPAWGLTYAGTYAVAELVENPTGEADRDAGASGPAGWRSEGAFSLNQDRLSIDKAVLSHGSRDFPTSVAGALALNFGNGAAFRASLEARQLDLDRTLGGGPNDPVKVSAAAERFLEQLKALPTPAIPGRLVLNVPGIVLGGAVIQDFAFAASTSAGGWRIENLSARLPGQSSVQLKGQLDTARELSFKGSAHIGVLQPGTFASWWRGATGQGVGRALSAFDLGGEVEIGERRISVSDVDARIGDSAISGRFSWNGAGRDGRSEIGTDLRADKVDFAQIVALGELLAGRAFRPQALADSYKVILAADSFVYDDVRLEGVSIDAAYADDVLNVTQFSIGNLGGSSFKVTGGKVEGVLGEDDLRGQLDARLDVRNIDGLAVLAEKVFPKAGLIEWLGRAAPYITPAVINARIVGAPDGNGSGFRISVADGVAGATTFDLEAASAGRVSTWRESQATLKLELDTPDSAALARQLGLAATAVTGDTGAHLELEASGIPADGLATTVAADFAGARFSATGTATLPAGSLPAFAGGFDLSADDAGNVGALAGLGAPFAGPVSVEGNLQLQSGEIAADWRNGQFGDRRATATLKLTRPSGSGWRLDGDVAADVVDLGWLMALGLGEPVLPTADPETPWSREPFSAITYGAVSGKVGVSAERLAIAGETSVTDARLSIALQPQRIDVDVTQGDLAGGRASGGFSLHNVEGNASATGQLNLTGAALDALVWRRDGRPVATGTVDLSANFETTGTNPAGMIASLTGGGAITVRDGEARYVNPNAGRSIVRASDLGQEYTEDALKIVIGEQIDADSLSVGEAGAAFQIAAGTLRMGGLQVRQEGVEASGSATFDINTARLESDWTLTFDPGDDKVQGTDPKIGLLFRGPVTAPSRSIDALQFASYLNTRREARMLEIIAAEEADQLEKDRLARLKVKLQQDRERTERLAREAVEAEERRVALAAAVGARRAALQVAREIAADQRAETALVRAAELAVSASQAASLEAQTATQRAQDARSRAAALASELDVVTTADESARARATAAAGALASAEAELVAAREVAEAARLRADSTNAVMFAALDEATSVRDDLSRLEAARTQANTALLAATATAQRSAEDLAAAEDAHRVAVVGLRDADAKLAAARRAADAAAERLVALESSLTEARTVAEVAAIAASDKNQESLEARGKRAMEQNALNRDQATAADAARALAEANQEVQDAQAAYDRAAGAFAGPSVPTGESVQVATDNAAANAASDRLQAARAEVDRLQTASATATAAVRSSEESLAGWRERAEAAEAAAATASEENARLQQQVNALQEQRDAAAVAAERATRAAGEAGAAFTEADERAQSANDRVVQARAFAKEAKEAERRAAEQARTAVVAAEKGAARTGAVTRTQEDAVMAAKIAKEELEQASSRVAAAESALASAQAEVAAANAAAAAALAARDAAEEAATRAAAAAEKATADADAAARLSSDLANDARSAQRRIGITELPQPASLTEVETAPDNGGAADEGVDRVYTNVPMPRIREQRQPLQLSPGALVIEEPMLLLPQ